MRASAYVGRVGGLAVALGVGAAVATGHGVAWASPTESDSTTSKTAQSAETDSGAVAGAASGPSTTDSKTPVVSPPTSKPTSSPKTKTAEPAEVKEADGDQDSKEAEPETASDAEAEVEVVSPDAADGDASSPDADDVRIEKKSSDRLVTKSTEPSASRVAAPKSTVEVSSVDDTTDQTIDEQADAPLERTAFSLASADLASGASITAIEEAPRVVVLTASAPPTVRLTPPRLVVSLLSAFGLGALASSIPGVPAESPFAMALLALGWRRETVQSFSVASRTATTSGTPVAALALTGAPTAAVVTEPGTTRTPVVISTNTHFIEFVTGAGNLNDTKNRFGIGGTDLGIMWDNGIPDDPTTAVNEHQVLIAFGDTFSNSYPVRSGIWRMNTLFRSSDTTLSNGLYVPVGIPHDPGKYSGSPMSDPNFAREILGHPRYAIGPEVTIIPTAAISIPGAGANGATRQYMNFMSVRSWDTPGRWTTNYSAIAYSDDNGQNWRSELVPSSSVRTAAAGRSIVPYVSGNQNFQQGAFVKPPEGSPDAAEGWVYSYGTPSGRGGTVYLSRVNQMQIMDQTKYQYWDGTSWISNKPSAAKPILPGTRTSGFFGFGATTTYPSVSEMSVQYNPYLKKYVMLYGDKYNNVVMRTSTTPQGTWSAPTTLVTSAKVPGLYAPMIHPWSGTTNVSTEDGKYLYWNLSTWNDYQVRLMRTDLTKV